MASVISSLDGALASLSQEAGSKHPQLHEVSNYALERLKNSRDVFVQAAQACAKGEENDVNMEDLAMPFLCALNTTNASPKIILTSLTAIQTLLAADILDSNVRRHVMNALLLHENASDSNIHVKILQTLPLLLTPKLVAVNEQILADAVGICCRFHSQGSVLASAGIKQIVTLIFGKVESELRERTEEQLNVDTPSKDSDSAASFGVGHVVQSVMPLSENAKSAISFLLELVSVAQRQIQEGEVSTPKGVVLEDTAQQVANTSEHQGWLSQAPITPALALELIDSVLAGHARLLTDPRTAHTFGQVVQNNIAPLVVALQLQHRNRHQDHDITAVVQILRFVVMLLSDYKQLLLNDQIHSMISSLLDTVDDMVTIGNAPTQLPYWKRAAVMESLSCICVRESTLQSLYQRFVKNRTVSLQSSVTKHSEEEADTSLFQRLVDSVCRFVMLSLSPRSSVEMDAITEQVNSKLATPLRGIQLLSDSASLPVDIPIEIAILHAAECVASIVDALAMSRPEPGTLVFGSRYANGQLVSPGDSRSSAKSSQSRSQSAVVVKAGQLRKRRHTATARTTDAPLVFNAKEAATGPSPAEEPNAGQYEEVDEDVFKGMVQESWYPVLGALRTLLESCNEENMVQFILKAYMSITNTCGALDLVDCRDAFIQSLCYFTLPNWQSDSALRMEATQGVEAHRLSTKHLQALKALFNIAHGLGAILGTSWHMVLETFQQLDFVIFCAAKSNKSMTGFGSASVPGTPTGTGRRGDNGLDEATWERRMMEDEIKIVASMLSSIFESSRYLDDHAVVNLATALTQLSFTILANKETLKVSPTLESPQEATGVTATIGGKARGMLSALGLSFPDPAASAVSKFSHQGRKVQLPPRNSSPNASESGAEALARMTYRSPPFALEKLVETTLLNCFRVNIIWDMTQSLLTTVANKSDPHLRQYGVQAMERLITKALLTDPSSAGPLAASGTASSAALPANRRGEYPPTLEFEKELMTPFVKLVHSSFADTREEALMGLVRLVSSAGDVLSETWDLVVGALVHVVTSDEDSLESHLPTTFKLTEILLEHHFIRLPLECQKGVIQCVRYFAQQDKQVNLSLTAVQTMFFAICDSLDRNADSIRSDSKELWKAVFEELAILSLDQRPEVRNSAMSTFCSVVKSGGAHMDASLWRTVLSELLMPLLRTIQQRASNASEHKETIRGEKLGRTGNSRMLVHHTRDTLEKQWLETKEYALKGITNVVKVCFGSMSRETWFLELWTSFVQDLKTTFESRVSKRVSIACVRALHELASVVCVGAREHLSQTRKVVNGALVAVDSAGKPIRRNGGGSESAALGLQDLEEGVENEQFWIPIRSVLVEISEFSSEQDKAGQSRGQSAYEMDLATEIASTIGDLYDHSARAFLRKSDAAMLAVRLLDRLIQGFPMKLDGLLTTIQRASLHAMVSLPPLPDDAWSFLLKKLHWYNTSPTSSQAFARRSKQAFTNLVAHAPALQRFTIVEDSVRALGPQFEQLLSLEDAPAEQGDEDTVKKGVTDVTFLVDVLQAGMKHMVPVACVDEFRERHNAIWEQLIQTTKLGCKTRSDHVRLLRKKLLEVVCVQSVNILGEDPKVQSLLADAILADLQGILCAAFDEVDGNTLWQRDSNLGLFSLEKLFLMFQATFEVDQFSSRSLSLSKEYLRRFQVFVKLYLELDETSRSERLSGNESQGNDVNGTEHTQAVAGASVSSLLKMFTHASVCNSEFGSEFYPHLCQLVTVDDISVRAALREALLKYYVVSTAGEGK